MTTTTAAATVTGRDARPGQTIKDRGRWYELGEVTQEWPQARVRVFGAIQAGRETTVAVLDEEVYALRQPGQSGPRPVVLTFRDHDARPAADVTYQVRYRRRDYGGWYVCTAEHGRKLGWVCPAAEGGWQAHVASDAFLGDGPGDTGDTLDQVELHLFNGESQFECRRITYGETSRDYAATEILRRLHRYHAPALGFPGPHWGVRRWADR